MKKKNTLLKFIVGAAATVGLIHIANRAVNYLATKGGRLSSVKGKFFHWRNGDFFYQVTGSGKPLVLLHDITVSSSAYEWKKVVRELSAEHTVYVVDLPGCGRSAKDAITYIGFYYVQFIQAFLRDIVREKADIIAVGRSASIAVSTTSFDNGLIDQLILVTPQKIEPLADLRPLSSSLLCRILRIPIIGTLIYHVLAGRRMIDKTLSEEKFYNPFDVDDTVLDSYVEAAHLGNDKGRFLLASLIGGYMAVDISLALRRCRQRITLINGAKRADFKEVVGQYRDINTDIRDHAIEKACLLPHFEQPDLFVNAVNQILMDNDTEASEEIFAE